MSKKISHVMTWTSLAAATLVAATVGASGVRAGECPADKKITDATKPVDYKPQGVTDKVLAAIDLAKEPAKVEGRELRLRKLTIEPGGIVPWHSHGDRPAIIYIIRGTIVEHASDCAVPIVHKAGDVTPEVHTTSHWWKNEGKETVVLLSADLPRDPNDHQM
jgi:quercetin dioxygenase-like cupin family protein